MLSMRQVNGKYQFDKSLFCLDRESHSRFRAHEACALPLVKMARNAGLNSALGGPMSHFHHPCMITVKVGEIAQLVRAQDR